MKKTIRIFTLLLILSILIFGGYTLKCWLGFNLSDQYSISKYFPFKYLTHTTIRNPKPGTLIDDHFNTWSPGRRWSNLWANEKDLVAKEFDKNGYKSTRCIHVKSQSTKSWSLTSSVYYRVEQGDMFHFEAWMKIDNETQRTGLSVSSFDTDKKAIKYSFIKKNTEPELAGTWQLINISFKIPEGVEYIMPRLHGNNIGDFRADDIKFIKMKQQVE